MTKPLTKVRICPTCGVRYKASETIRDGRPGRVCPAGHFATYYELQKAENGGRAPVRQDQRRAPLRVVTPRQERAELLALLWMGAVDRLLAQLPERSVTRAMIEGATAQAYAVSIKLLDERPGAQAAPDERMAA